MARKTATINKKSERAVIIGAGITENFYFSHLQSLYNLKIKIRPRYFGGGECHKEVRKELYHM